MKIKISHTKFNNAFLPLIIQPRKQRNIWLMGGAGSGKSVFCAQYMVLKSFQTNTNILVCRKWQVNIKYSAYRQIVNIIRQWNLSQFFQINQLYIKNKQSGSQILFKGLDDTEKIKSISNIKIIWVQQATQILRDDFIQLGLRLRGRTQGKTLAGYQIWLSFNPVSKSHWIYNYIYKNPKTKSNFMHKSTYLDNSFLDDEYKSVLNSYLQTSPYHYQVYCLGQWGTHGQLVLPNFRIQQFDIPAIISTSNYVASGLDFGYNDPSTSLLVTQNDQTLYICQQLYGRKWTNTDLAYQIANNTTYIKESTIYADCAEPQRIQQLRKSGYDITPVVKKTIKQSLNNLKTMPIIIHPNCVKTIQQISGYQYQKDKKSGEYTDNPIQINNHCMDALRYATMKYFMQRNISGGRVVAA